MEDIKKKEDDKKEDNKKEDDKKEDEQSMGKFVIKTG